MRTILLIFSLGLILSSCSRIDTRKESASDPNVMDENEVASIKESLIKQNQQRIKMEMAAIEAYVKKMPGNFKTSETGLYYRVDKVGVGVKPSMLSEVKLKYKILLMDSSYCYSSDSSGVLQFIIGQSNEPSGLQEALLYLNEGSDATIVVPSHLAYGITGDGDKIPGGEPIVYNVTLLAVRNKCKFSLK